MQKCRQINNCLLVDSFILNKELLKTNRSKPNLEMKERKKESLIRAMKLIGSRKEGKSKGKITKKKKKLVEEN